MNAGLRKYFPYAIGLLLFVALAWAVSFDPPPPADFTFINGAEIKSVDPSKVTGAPEGRIINAVLEGLYRPMPNPDDPTQMIPLPAAATGHTLSDDGRVYTFDMRQDAYWVNPDGSRLRPVTAEDFRWSWMRTLHPATACEYVYQLYYIKNADKYNRRIVEPGDPVEVELSDAPNPDQDFPRGTIVRGELLKIDKPPEPEIPAGVNDIRRGKIMADWNESWVYEVQIDGVTRKFTRADRPAGGVEKCRWLLLDFNHVGVKVNDKDQLEVTLKDPTPYFLDLAAFYVLYPMNRECIETHGFPNWTKTENIVTNGPFRMVARHIRERIRLQKNQHYWDAGNVKLNTVDALAVESETTNLNMFMEGQVDWATTVPSAVVPELKGMPEFRSGPMMTTYFYRLNVKRKPLNDKRVRQALAMAINKQTICDRILRAGQVPARTLVPPGLTGYESPARLPYDPARARELLAAAGFPGGQSFPKLQILYNTNESHKIIAEVIQRQWRENLRIDVEIKNLEWKVFLDALHKKEYDIARSAWIGDYPDPNTFLDMFVTDGPQNETGWSNKKYDELIAAAAAQGDAARRMQMMHDAEEILVDEVPIIPVYFYVSINMVQPQVKNFHSNIQDIHPLHIIEIDKSQAGKAGGRASR